MHKNFWHKAKRPILALAPMANVTDAAFRRIIAKYGKPDVMWTEFVPAEGLMSPGRDNLLLDLAYTKAERPIVAQLFTGKPEVMEKAAAFVAELGFDGIDINMGCPDRNIEKSGAGAALIKKPELAQELIYAAKRGAGKVPVSVKTRLGYNRMEYETWLPRLLETGLDALTVHLRTRKELSEAPAHWDLASRIVEIRDKENPKTLILGNGDVASLAEAEDKAKASGLDGVMIGRGIFGNPWFFARKRTPVSTADKLRVALEHVELFEKMYGPDGKGRWRKGFDVMKKHFKAYVNGFDGAKELRARLMETHSAEEVAAVLASFEVPV